MALRGLDLCLLVAVIVVVTVDIILALCLRFVLPYHVTHRGWYPINNKLYQFDDAVDICPCLRGVFPSKSRESITFQDVKFKRSLKDPLTDQIGQHPYLVSLSIPAYSDDPETRIFACNGLVLTYDTLLTTENCVFHESEWRELSVRSRSSYWSHSGETHIVVDVSPGKYAGLVELKIRPEFSETIIPKHPLQYVHNGNWTYAVALGWNDRMYQQALSSRFKYKLFDIQQWTSKNHSAHSSELCYSVNNCKFSSRPLVTSCYQLLGMKSNEGPGCKGFVGFTSNEDNKEKLESTGCRLIYKDHGFLKDEEVCPT